MGGIKLISLTLPLGVSERDSLVISVFIENIRVGLEEVRRGCRG